MHKIDLHVHTEASPDSCIAADDVRAMLKNGNLDAIAITDHNTTEMALELKKEFGPKIIVGEEIKTIEGEIIGLFLTSTIEPGLSVIETIGAIRRQNGLVYIPHPFDKHRRSGLPAKTLDAIADEVDIIETCNGRDYLTRHARRAKAWASHNKVAQAHSSDAHGVYGWGKTYSVIDQLPTRDTLVKELHTAEYCSRKVGLFGLFYPTFNLLRNRRG